MANEMMSVDMKTGEVQSVSRPQMSIFSDEQKFMTAFKMATELAKSTIVPKNYQGSPSNCLIAIEMSTRINTSPMMVMQNLYVVNGSPAWSSQWIIAMINNSHRYKTELKFDLKTDKNGRPVSCMAWAEDYNGNKVVGPNITWEMAEAEGWTKKNGSKWMTMPEVMFRYRAASFFGRLNCPDMIMGIYSQDEVIDGFSDPIEVEDAVEVDPVATDEQHEKFIQAITAAMPEANGEDKNKVYSMIKEELGVAKKSEFRVSTIEKAISMIPEAIKKIAPVKE